MKNKIFFLISIATVAGFLTACDDWTEPEVVSYDVTSPSEQNPELYARYTESLRAYKQNPHFLVFGRMGDVTGSNTTEKDYLRSLPDSLDVVTLAGADHFSDFDREDMAEVQQVKGTKVLYGIDLTEHKNTFEDRGDLTGLMATYLDSVVKAVADEGFDGISVMYEGNLGFGTENMDDLKQLLIAKLTPIAGTKANTGKLLIFEGNPTFIPEANRDDFDYYVLNTTKVKDAYALKLEISYANGYAAVPLERIILSATPTGKINNAENLESAAIPVMASCVVSAGPVGGLSIINIGDDYYNPSKNYQLTCEAIQFLNPSPLK